MTVYLVGAGPGDPGLITRRGAELLGRADVVVYDRLIPGELLELAPAEAELVDVGKRPGDSDHQESINALLVARGRSGGVVVRLKGGDPFVFGRGGEEAQVLRSAGVPVEVVPGVTSAFAVPAYAGVPVTQRGVATSVTVITGHGAGGEAPEEDWEGLARAGGTLVILMGLAHRAEIAERLMAGGRDPDSPVLVVESGSTPRQRTVSTHLAGLGAAELSAPATIVIGAVAALRFDWFEDRPLHGRRVVVTRPRHQAAELIGALARTGAEIVTVPVVTIEDPADGGAALAGAAARLGDYDWLLFTSANAVERFFARLRDARSVGTTRVAAVGGATARALRAVGVDPDVVPADERAEGLVAALLDPQSPATPRALFPRAASVPAVLAPGLRAAGWTVDEVEAYRTTLAVVDAAVLDAVAGADAVVFTSPSTVDGLVELMGLRSLPGLVACIGPTTSSAARRHGLTVAVEPARRDVTGLVDALVDHVAGAGSSAGGAGSSAGGAGSSVDGAGPFGGGPARR